jgi:uncharacterized RDD family membrane protein YckC
VNRRQLRIKPQLAPQDRSNLVYDAPMMEDQVRVQGATGVDLTLTIAGPGNRSYAFIIDWHVRALLAAAWLLLATMVFQLGLNVKTHDALLSLLPAFGIYFLYHPVIEIALRGRTPGKRIAGLRIVTRQGGTPSVGALLIRNLFRLIDSLPAFYGVGLVCCFVTTNRVRIGDMAAGTLLVVEDSGASKSLQRFSALAGASHLSLDGMELVDQLLERWQALESSKRIAIARSVLERLEPGMVAAELASLNELQLQARLLQLVQLGDAAKGGRAPRAAGSA